MTVPGEEGEVGLTQVALPELRQLLRAVEAGRLDVPVTSAGLQAAGLGGVAEALGLLEALDRRGLVALLHAAIAERVRRPVPHVSLVWTGAEAKASRSLDTAVVVRELFQGARRSVLVAGFSFDHGEEILRPLHEAMRDRSVTASLFLDLSAFVVPGVPGDPAAAAVAGFMAKNWPFGEQRPAVFYDPRTADKGARVSLHAKCVVVDERRALVTSANFTARGQTKNVEVGVLVEDPEFARTLVGQWLGLVDAGLMARGE